MSIRHVLLQPKGEDTLGFFSGDQHLGGGPPTAVKIGDQWVGSYDATRLNAMEQWHGDDITTQGAQALVLAWEGQENEHGALALAEGIAFSTLHAFRPLLASIEEAVQHNAFGRLQASIDQWAPGYDLLFVHGPGED